MKRFRNSLVNTITSSSCKVFELVISVISRVLLIQVLGVEYLGINGLFANILFLFSIAELGFSFALVHSMYKPMAEANYIELDALSCYFRKIYLYVVFAMSICGVLFIPFIPHVIADKGAVENIGIIYIIFLLNFLVPYLVVYRKSLIIVSQKEYIVSIYTGVLRIVQIILQIIILYSFRNYLLFILIQLLITLLLNVIIYWKSNRLFPFLKNKTHPSVDNSIRKTIKSNAKALFINNISGIVFSGSGNIIISSILGLAWVGIYTNYTTIINALSSFINAAFSSITASIGDFVVKSDMIALFMLYRKVLLLNHLIILFCSINCLCLFNDFVNITYGVKYAATSVVVWLVVFNFVLTVFRLPTLIFRNVLGIFRADRYKGVFECIINISLSLFLVQRMGLVGVLLGTAVSSILVSIWIEPLMLFRHGFKLHVSKFWLYQLPFILCEVFLACVIYYISSNYGVSSWEGLIFKGLIVSAFIIVIFFVSCFRMPEFEIIYRLLRIRR